MTTTVAGSPTPAYLRFLTLMWRYIPLVYLARTLRGFSRRQWRLFFVVFGLSLILGAGVAAAADPGSAETGWSSFVPLQDYAHGGGKTLVEDIPTSRYFIDDEVDGNVVNAVTAAGNGLANTIMITTVSIAWVLVAIISWLLGTSDVGEDAFDLSQLVGNVAAETMGWLFPTCLALAAVAVWVDHKRDKTGASGILTVFLVAVLATGFSLNPGIFLNGMDTVRAGGQKVVESVMPDDQKDAQQLPFEYGNPDYSQNTDTEEFTRKVTDTIWRASVVTPWCMVEFGSIDVCKKYGTEMLTRADKDKRTKEVIKKQIYKDDSIGGKDGDAGTWVHGEQWPQRLGMSILALAVCMLMLVLVASLVFSAVIALIQALLLFVMGTLFLVVGMIPGLPRTWLRNWAIQLSAAIASNILALFLLVIALGAVTTIFTNPAMEWFQAYGLSIIVLFGALGLRSTVKWIVQSQTDDGGAGSAGRITRMLMMRQIFRSMSHSKTSTRAGESAGGRQRQGRPSSNESRGSTGGGGRHRNDVVSTRMNQGGRRATAPAGGGTRTRTAAPGGRPAVQTRAAARARAAERVQARTSQQATNTTPASREAARDRAAERAQTRTSTQNQSVRTPRRDRAEAPQRQVQAPRPGQTARVPGRDRSGLDRAERDRAATLSGTEARRSAPSAEPARPQRKDPRLDPSSGLRGGPRTAAPRPRAEQRPAAAASTAPRPTRRVTSTAAPAASSPRTAPSKTNPAPRPPRHKKGR